ncbi:MAG: pyridoxamine kinase [Clostridiales bacterium]|nr:pyridoxamine kinase [Clostridiales bacterium]
MKKIIAAHDLSGLGTASLGAVIPIISSMGSYVCSLPTAVLSTITGVFEGYAITGLTEQMQRTIQHWDGLGVTFDYIYSGFLGSAEQVDIILDAASRFHGCYLVVDPVFADNGRLYPTMDGAMVENMKRLAARANLITPNFTEARFLLGETPPEGVVDETRDFPEAEAKDWLTRLCGTGPERAVITGGKFRDGMYVTAYDKPRGAFWKLKCEYVPAQFHGTGDIFTSVLVGALARGDCFETAVALAARFVRTAIDATLAEQWEPRMGVLVEKVLGGLGTPPAILCERF